MFTKIFLSALILTLSGTAFSSESTVSGRYRVDFTGDSNVSTAQAGRTRSTTMYTQSDTYQSNESSAQLGESRVTGRHQSNNSGYATVRNYNYVPNTTELRTQRAMAMDVSFNPANRVTLPDSK